MRQKRKFVECLLGGLALVAFDNSCGAQQPEPPRITAIEPRSAVTTPGAKVMIVGANFSPDSIPCFGGLQAREVTFINASALQAVTPYLRPGSYKLDLKSNGTTIHSDVVFTASPAPVDSSLDLAEGMTTKGKTSAAIGIFTNIATTHSDYDVRAYAHYRAAQLYLAQGAYWPATEQAALIWDAKASHGVHSSWQYRLLNAEMDYSASQSNDHDTDLRIVEAAINWDVTENPELRFWRALVSARFGKMHQANADLKFALGAEPENPSYRALAAYIGVLEGDKTRLAAFRDQQVNDARALGLLGQATYIIGDHDGALAWWAAEGKIGIGEATLDCGSGRKHADYGQTRVGAALLAECAAVTPDSIGGKAAKERLADLVSTLH